jgi:hypothetical protein
MPLDPWSVVLSLVLSVFGFLIFLLGNKKHELGMIDKKVSPAAKEALDVLIKNFLSFGDIPTKSKLISIMTSVARKHQVQLLTHLPIQNIIDNLVYYVISNDLVEPYKKKEISDSLIRLKMEPISSEDYLQMVADNEEASSWKQKLAYSQLTKVLISASLLIVVLGIVATQFKASLGPKATYLITWLLISTIGFTALVAGYTLLTVLSHFSLPVKTPVPALPSLLNAPSDEGLHTLATAKKLSKSQVPGAPLMQRPKEQQSKIPINNSLQSRQPQAERMMSIDSVKNINEKMPRNRLNNDDELLISIESEGKESQSSFETI